MVSKSSSFSVIFRVLSCCITLLLLFCLVPAGVAFGSPTLETKVIIITPELETGAPEQDASVPESEPDLDVSDQVLDTSIPQVPSINPTEQILDTSNTTPEHVVQIGNGISAVASSAIAPLPVTTVTVITRSEAVAWLDSLAANKTVVSNPLGGYAGECASLAAQYFVKLTGRVVYADNGRTGNGNQFSDNNHSVNLGWERGIIYSSTQLQAGDVVVWLSGTYGHVAIYSSGAASNATLYQQNTSGRRYVTKDTVAGNIVGCTYVRPVWKNASVPAQDPSGIVLSKTDIATNDTVTVSWQAVSGATKYRVRLIDSAGNITATCLDVTTTSATLAMNNAGTYRFRVYAGNTVGFKEPGNYSANIVVHDPLTVSFLDWDNKVLTTQSVKYGGTAIAPTNPLREGFTFDKWDSALTGLTANKTFKALYKVNTYTVAFIDYQGKPINTQTVSHGLSAVAPTPVTPAGFEFIGWDKDDYQSVTQNLKVTAVFAWENTDLPITLEINTAVRHSDLSGYYVNVSVANYPNAVTRGKVIVALKTQAGKMVASEMTAISLPANGATTLNIYVPYSGIATVAEVSFVGLADDTSTGVPLAEQQSSAVDLRLLWSDWSTNPAPTGAGIEVQSATQYRTSTRQTSTSSSSSMSGWSLFNTTSDWGSWSGWSTANPGASTTRQVETRQVLVTAAKTQYSYDAWRYWNTSKGAYYYTPINNHTGSVHLFYGPVDSALPFYFTTDMGPCYGPVGGVIWFNPQTTTVAAVYRTEYRYRDLVYTYHFERWSEWGDWTIGDPVPDANSNLMVETRTVYRFKNNAIDIDAYNYKRYRYIATATGTVHFSSDTVEADALGYPGVWEYNKSYTPLALISGGIYGSLLDPWYRADINSQGSFLVFHTQDTLENTEGIPRTLSGELNMQSKKVTLLVFHGNNTDPTANQLVYIDQTTLAEDGSYSFDYLTRLEPTGTTGDFIVMIAVEGGTTPIYIGTIKAPLSTHTVTFVEWDGTPIKIETVIEGGCATLPTELNSRTGYSFVGWDNTITGISSDVTIQAQYEALEFTTLFYDWDGTELDTQVSQYGDIVIGPEAYKENASFAYWAEENEPTLPVTMVTSSMALVAQYDDDVYTVTFLDWDGEVLSQQQVSYGNEAEEPYLEGTPGYGLQFAYWSSYDFYSVQSDLVIYPVARYIDTTPTPTASVADGSYIMPFTVSLDPIPEGTVVYYTTDGSYPMFESTEIEVITNGTLYTGPITINQTTDLIWVAFSSEKNPSDPGFASYTSVSAGAPGSGDINGDGLVTMDEAVLVVQLVSGFGKALSPDQFAAADMDLDGYLTMSDVSLILRRSAGL